jgi:hypothetical protein
MGDVYQKASKVVVWVGEEEGGTDSEMEMDLLCHLFQGFVDLGETEAAADVTNDLGVQGDEPGSPDLAI